MQAKTVQAPPWLVRLLTPAAARRAMALGSPLCALLVLLGVKIVVDLKAHLKEHTS